MTTAERSLAYDDTFAVGTSAYLSTGRETAIDEGQILAGRYRVGPLLGAGGMGLVFEGTHLELQNPVAIKVVRPNLASDRHILERFVNEARSVAGLTNPHVARVLDAGHLRTGEAFLVMERLVGQELSRLLNQQGRLDWRTAVSYVLQACDGLTEAHDKGLIHRDLKPEHLFIVTSGLAPLVKILDFGISKNVAVREARVTDPGDSIGSPSYMSPEQVKNPAAVDQRTDIWSLGVVLYEAISGRLPFPGDTVGQIQWQVLAEPPVPLCGRALEVPEELERVILGCLQKDPNERFVSVRELSQALRRLLEDERTPSPPTAAHGSGSIASSRFEEARRALALATLDDDELTVAGLPKRSGTWMSFPLLLLIGVTTAGIALAFGFLDGWSAWSRGLDERPAPEAHVPATPWLPPTALPRFATVAAPTPSPRTQDDTGLGPTQPRADRSREPELTAEEIETRYRDWLREEHLVPVDEVKLDASAADEVSPLESP